MKTLDLHGYKTSDAIDAIDRFIYKAVQDGEERVRIMTGKGTGAIFKTTTDYLKKAHYPWKFEKMANGKSNQGVLVIFLD